MGDLAVGREDGRSVIEGAPVKDTEDGDRVVDSGDEELGSKTIDGDSDGTWKLEGVEAGLPEVNTIGLLEAAEGDEGTRFEAGLLDENGGDGAAAEGLASGPFDCVVVVRGEAEGTGMPLLAVVGATESYCGVTPEDCS